MKVNKMMKVVLVNLKFEKGKITNFRKQEHLGLGYIGAVCQQSGHQVCIINAQFDDIENDTIIQRIVEQNPDLVGFTVYEELIHETIQILQQVKKWADIPIVIGGHYATFNTRILMETIPEIDYINLGEGEQSFTALVNALDSSVKYPEFEGVCYRKQGEIVNTGNSRMCMNLDTLPYPMRAVIDRRYRITNISASRGCYGQCSFCSTHSFYLKHKQPAIRIRDAVEVVKEMEYLVKTQNAYHFFFTDDNFMVNERLHPGWVNQFVTEILNRKLDVVFNFDCRVDDIELSLFSKLKQAGLIGVFLGVESNAESTLKLYNKGTSSQQNYQAITQLRRLRIDYWIGNIMFQPYTLLDDIQKDIDFFERIKYCLFFNYSNPVSCLVGRLKVYKGTDIYNRLMADGKIVDEGLECRYEIQDPKVDALWEFVQRYKPNVERLVELDPIQSIELANKSDNQALSSKLHEISRKFMRADFDIFKCAHNFLSTHAVVDFQEYSQELLNKSKAEFSNLYEELSGYVSQVLGDEKHGFFNTNR